MNREQVEQRAYDLFQGGLICAESVLMAVLESAKAPADGFTPGIATCFGGGVGRCKEEMCGALAGARVLMLGRGSEACVGVGVHACALVRTCGSANIIVPLVQGWC